MAATLLSGSVDFLASLGVYDVVLPFLLVFTLLFAFLEKTKILGLEVLKDKNGKEHTFTRKNLNSMVAFTVSFFVIASSQLVRIISEIMANVVILIVLGVSYLLATGVFHTGQEEYKVSTWEKTTFSIISLVGIIFIVLNALGWLDIFYKFLNRAWYDANIASALMVLVFVGFMVWITWTPAPKVEEKKGD